MPPHLVGQHWSASIHEIDSSNIVLAPLRSAINDFADASKEFEQRAKSMDTEK